MSKHNHESPGNVDSQSPDDDLIGRLVCEYMDRLIGGDSVDVDDILKRHQRIGPQVVRELETFTSLSPDPDPEDDASLGTLGDYTLRRQIGRGGMGVVYEAWQNSVARSVALKVLPAGIAADNKAFMRFMREAKTAAQLAHPNVVGVHGMGVEENTPYYAMEYVEGETLAQVLANLRDADAGTDSPFGAKDEVVYFGHMAKAFAEVADGLQHAHSKGIIHRDIKPSNLVLDAGTSSERNRGGRLRILDFGLARLEGQESLTLSGDFVGTPLYMSPEQARRKKIPVDHRTDVYSLGATMYEAICGRPPFRGKSHADTLSQIIERDPVEPRKVNPRVPKDLETIVLKCLRKDAGDRYGTAEALGQDLRRLVRGDPVEARPVSRHERLGRFFRRHKRAAGILALLAAATLVLFAVSFFQISKAYDLVTVERRELRRQRDQVAQLLYVSNIRLAHADWQQGNQDRFAELLERHRPTGDQEDLRGWEWYYLSSLAKRQTFQEFVVGPGAARAVDWSPDGNRLAVGGDTGEVRILEVNTGDVILGLKVGKEPVRAVAWSRDADRLAAVTEEGSTSAWSMDEAATLFSSFVIPTFEQGRAFRSVAWNPDGSLLAVAGGDQTIGIRKALDGEVARRIVVRDEVVRALSWSPDGSHLIAACDPLGELVVWETSTWAEHRRATIHSGDIRDVAYSPDGSLVATASEDQTVRILEARTLLELERLEAHNGAVLCVRWSPDGSMLASASSDGLIKLWDTLSWEQLPQSLGHGDLIWSLAWNPDASRLASASQNGTVKAWDVSLETALERGFASGPGAWDRNGDLIAVFDDAPTELKVLDLKTDVIRGRIPLDEKPDRLVTGPAGNRLAIATPGALSIWNLPSQKLLHTVECGGALQVRCVGWSPDAPVLATGHENGTVQIRSTRSWNVIDELLAHQDRVAALAWSPDGTRFATAGPDQKLKIWDSRRLELEYDLDRCDIRGRTRLYTSPEGIAWSPDNKWLVTTCALLSSGLSVWSTETFEKVYSSRGHLGGVMTVAWSPEGTRLATSGLDRTVKIWQIGPGGDCHELLSLEADMSGARAMAWDPAGRRLMADVGIGRRLRVFDATGAMDE